METPNDSPPPDPTLRACNGFAVRSEPLPLAIVSRPRVISLDALWQLLQEIKATLLCWRQEAAEALRETCSHVAAMRRLQDEEVRRLQTEEITCTASIPCYGSSADAFIPPWPPFTGNPPGPPTETAPCSRHSAT